MLGNMNEVDYLKDLIKQFFDILDTKCESDSGKVYNPVRIDCSSTLCHIELVKLLDEMKKAI